MLRRMAAIFQTTPGGLIDNTKDKTLMATFFSKIRAQPAVVPAPPPPAPPPLETLATSAAPKDTAPRKTVRKQPSDVDDDLRQHLKQEGISFLAFADFGNTDTSPPPPKEQRKEASGSVSKVEDVNSGKKVEVVAPKATLQTVHDFYTPRKVPKKTQLQEAAAPIKPASAVPVTTVPTGTSRPKSAAPVAYPPVPATPPTLASPIRPVTASSAKSSKASTFKSLFKREGTRKGRTLKKADTKDESRDTGVNSPPALSPSQIPTTTDGAPQAPPSNTAPEQPPPIVKVSPPTTQLPTTTVEAPVVRNGIPPVRPSVSAIGSTITVKPSTTTLQKPEHIKDSNRPSPPTLLERRSPDLNRPARDSGKFVGRRDVEAPTTPTEIPKPYSQTLPEPLQSDAASFRSDSEMMVRSADPQYLDSNRPRNGPGPGSWGPNHTPYGSPRGSWRGPPPEMMKRRSDQMNGNPLQNGYGRGYGPPPHGFPQRHGQQMSYGPGGYFPPYGDVLPDGYNRPNGNGHSDSVRLPRGHGPHPSRLPKPTQSAAESKEHLPTEQNSSNPSDESEPPNSSTEDLRKNCTLPVPVMLPPGNVYTPSVTDIQRNCDISHRSTVLCSNVHHRIQCMVCLTDAASERFMCSYCALRFCTRCKDEFTCGLMLDQVSERAQAENWASQAIPASPSRPSGVNMAWETACALDNPNRPRAPPRLREPPHGRRPYPPWQRRPGLRGEMPRFDNNNSPSSGSRSSSPTRRRPERDPNGDLTRAPPRPSSSYDDNRENDFEVKRRVARNMIGGERNGIPIPLRNPNGYFP